MDVNIHEAKTHLSRLVPVERNKHRKLGWAAGEVTIHDDFDAPLPPEIEESFYR